MSTITVANHQIGETYPPFNSSARPRPGFLSLPELELHQFESIAQEITHPAGAVIFSEGDPASGIYLLCSGQVKLTTASTNHHRMILKIAQPGDLLGLSAILNELPYEVTAQTLVQSAFKYVARQLFLDFVHSSVRAGYATALALAREHHEVFLGARRLALSPSATARIAHVLIEFLHSAGVEGPAQSFSLMLTHAELASLAGTSRETVTRLLNQFEREGIIARNDSMVTVVQLAQLERLAG
ncbi:MAG TPA: Crp/Fnr family transcriptional regulator [Acidobacteriaceae bacterium]|nr:Crp/Fnr family transcriptional regulator [Acidobacteriaceae bacterium]